MRAELDRAELDRAELDRAEGCRDGQPSGSDVRTILPGGPTLMNPTSAANQPTIRLDQFLKLTGSVATGGQAKQVIQAGEVTVNGLTETRRSRQLQPGDIVTWNQETFEVGGDRPS